MVDLPAEVLAVVAELVDAHASEACSRKRVWVRVPLTAPIYFGTQAGAHSTSLFSQARRTTPGRRFRIV